MEQQMNGLNFQTEQDHSVSIFWAHTRASPSHPSIHLVYTHGFAVGHMQPYRCVHGHIHRPPLYTVTPNP